MPRIAPIPWDELTPKQQVSFQAGLNSGAFRIALENVRNPDIGMPDFPFGLTMGMILSIPMVLAGLALIALALRRPLPPIAEEQPQT